MHTGPNHQGVVRTHRLRPFQSIHTRTVDFALRRARIHLIPKVEQDRVRRQCEAAIGASDLA